MAGLYLHVPFCKQACHYCNFHFSTSLRHHDQMVAAILRELDIQQHYLGGDTLGTVYFGGGTPSLLSVKALDSIFNQINKHYTVLPDAEITLEANPDDLTAAYLQDLYNYTPVNRLSIGVQSFFNDDLIWMNRAHNSRHAVACIEQALTTGFQNLTIDLIYGSPTTTNEHWAENLRIALGYPIPHLSSYCLTVEEGTALHHHVKHGTSKPVDEERSAQQFEMLMEQTAQAGFEHYEISNFAKPGYVARHNSNYWRGVPYLGIGPSAHSFNSASRQWNVANNVKYLAAIEQGDIPFEMEFLTTTQRYNEYVMMMLRTTWGCDIRHIATFGAAYSAHFTRQVQTFLNDQTMQVADDCFSLTNKGRLLADHITVELFFDKMAE